MADDILDQEKQSRLDELYKKEDRTDDESKEFEDLKKERKDRTQKRINQLHYEKEKERERAEEAEKRIAELERANSQPAPAPTPAAPVSDEMETVGGKQYYTFDALQQKVARGEMTDSQAYKLNDARIVAQAEERAWERLQKKQEEQTQEQSKAEADRKRQADVAKVLKEYPYFDNRHPDFNPSDPLYKEANRLWQRGYKNDPEGFSAAIDDAKRILGLNKKKPDISDDLSVNQGDRFAANQPGQQTPQDVSLTAEEKDAAYRMYHMGGIINPKTGQIYTEAEAIQKAKKAKLARIRR